MGNCNQCVGRDCGFKYQQYYGKNKEELGDYLKEKINNRYGIRFSHQNKQKDFFCGISEKSPQYEEDSLNMYEAYNDGKVTNNVVIPKYHKHFEKSIDKIGERCETEKINKTITHIPKFKEMNDLTIKANEEVHNNLKIRDNEIKMQNLKSPFFFPKNSFDNIVEDEKSNRLNHNEINSAMFNTANFHVSPNKISPLLKSSPNEDSLKKTPSKKFQFQNQIFDFKEIQSTNTLYKGYDTIFNEEDFSDFSNNEKNDEEIEEKFPSYKMQRKTNESKR